MAIIGEELFPAGIVEYDETNPATWAVITGTSPDTWVVAFDGSADQTIIFPFVMPDGYASGTLTLLLQLAMATDTSGDVDIDVSVEARDVAANDPVNADSFDTVNSQDNNSVPGTALLGFEVSVTLTNKDSVAAGDRVRIKVTRDGTNDAANGLMYLLSAVLKES